MIRFFLDRPVLANVIALVIVVLGGAALLALPVSQYPPITPPVVQVSAHYPGGNAKSVMEHVALPIEQQVNGVEHLLYMQSTSTDDGTYTLNATFAIGTDPNAAQVLVQNRVAQANAQLPQGVQQQGVTVRKRSTAILQMYTLQSTDPRHDTLFLSNYATIHMRDELARLPGVGDVTVFGTGQYSIRVWLDPQRLQQRGLVPADVINAIRSQNRDVSAGALGASPAPAGQPLQLTLNVDGTLRDPAQFDDIVIKADSQDGGRPVHVRDVGHTELGASSYGQYFELDGKPAAGIAVFQLPDANALDVGRAVQAKMAEMGKQLPPGMRYSLPFDTTTFVNDSVDEVYRTLVEAGVLVLLVIVFFLQNARAALVPATTVPVTVVGAFAAIWAMGFSVNLLTLFALILVIGIVVDDAIIVVEGVSQHIEAGLNPRDATLAAMRELTAPIVSITLVLVAVFLPVTLLPGIGGQMFRQFGLVIAATTVISALNALTLKPVQSAQWLRAPGPGHKGVLYRAFDRVYLPIERAYERGVGFALRRAGAAAVLALLLLGLCVFAFTRVPTGFIPLEDQGYMLVSAQLSDASALGTTHDATRRMEAALRQVPGVDRIVTIGGISALDNNASLSNAALLYVILKGSEARAHIEGADLRGIYAAMNRRLGQVSGVRALVIVPPPIQGVGNGGGFQLAVTLTDGSSDFAKLARATDALVSAAGKDARIGKAFTSFRADAPQFDVTVDRERAAAMGVAVGDVFDTLQGYTGASYVNQFVRYGHTFQVFVQAEGAARAVVADLGRMYVHGAGGAMVALDTLAQVRDAKGPPLVSMYNLKPAATINGIPATGTSTGAAMAAIETLAARTLPPGVGIEWTAMSYQEKQAGNSAYWMFGLALLLVYCVLAGQYESWLLPGSVILGIPFALLGTAGALVATKLANNLYVQIGIVLLIALGAKNAILIVEAARKRRASGEDIRAAALAAARVRFRPIVMTSIAFILGVAPLLMPHGASASARISLGLTVFSGMIASTLLGTLLVPCLYVVLEQWAAWWRRRRAAAAAAPAPGTARQR